MPPNFDYARSHLPYSERKAAISKALDDSQDCARRMQTCAKEGKARRSSQRNTVWIFVINDDYYTHGELDYQQQHYMPLIIELGHWGSYLRVLVEGMQRDYSAREGTVMKLESILARSMENTAAWLLRKNEKTQQKGRKVIEKRENRAR